MLVENFSIPSVLTPKKKTSSLGNLVFSLPNLPFLLFLF